jgi:hypothetical protein
VPLAPARCAHRRSSHLCSSPRLPFARAENKCLWSDDVGFCIPSLSSCSSLLCAGRGICCRCCITKARRMWNRSRSYSPQPSQRHAPSPAPCPALGFRGLTLRDALTAWVWLPIWRISPESDPTTRLRVWGV